MLNLAFRLSKTTDFPTMHFYFSPKFMFGPAAFRLIDVKSPGRNLSQKFELAFQSWHLVSHCYLPISFFIHSTCSRRICGGSDRPPNELPKTTCRCPAPPRAFSALYVDELHEIIERVSQNSLTVLQSVEYLQLDPGDIGCICDIPLTRSLRFGQSLS